METYCLERRSASKEDTNSSGNDSSPVYKKKRQSRFEFRLISDRKSLLLVSLRDLARLLTPVLMPDSGRSDNSSRVTVPLAGGLNSGADDAGEGGASVLVRADANLFFAMSRSRGESFLVVTEGAEVDVGSSPAASAGAPVVVVVANVGEVEGERPRMGILGRRGRTTKGGLLVVVVVVVPTVTNGRDSDGLSINSDPSAFLSSSASAEL